MAGLASGGRRVLALDLPGHGSHGDAGPANLERAVDRVAACVDGPFDLLGYSMGGRLALHCAFRLPARVRRLVLESASPGLADADDRHRRRAADDALAERILEGGVAAFAHTWADREVLRPGPRRSPGDAERADGIRRAQRPEGLAAALRGLGTGSLPSLWHRLPEIGVPTRLLVGALDEKFVGIARRMAASLEDVEVEVVPDAGHTVHLDRPDAWLRAVRRWLDAPA